MPAHELQIWLLKATWLGFVLAFGCCVGSLINVLVYRLPRGLNVVFPASRCPSCQTTLTWRENIPVIGWLRLRGRCRFCGCRISPEYPIVEASVGLLFAGFFVLWYMLPDGATLWSIPWGAMKPEWVQNDATITWPTFTLTLMLLGSLAAMTLVDAKTFTIPLVLTWFPALLALVVHPIHAYVVQHNGGRLLWHAKGWNWSIPTPGTSGWTWIGLAIGGTVGLGVANILLAAGLIKRSFADYAEWEAGELRKNGEDATRSVGAPGEGSELEPGAPADMWIQYPHARREVLKEVLFLAPAIGLGWAGWVLAERLAGPLTPSPPHGALVSAHAVPLWLDALGGVLIGYLIGGGVVWLVRILGSLAFGKEAMGMGDVHLMAAVGACIGWIDATLAFFLAAFVGIAWAILGAAFGGRMQRAMPYGPYLAIASVLVLVLKLPIESMLTWIAKSPAPIDLP